MFPRGYRAQRLFRTVSVAKTACWFCFLLNKLNFSLFGEVALAVVVSQHLSFWLERIGQHHGSQSATEQYFDVLFF
jgi:hypothetical protein